MLIGYFRLYSDGDAAAQRRALAEAGCEQVVEEPPGVEDGEAHPELGELLARLRRGDVVVVPRLDSLGSSLPEVARQVLHLPPQLGEVAHARFVCGHPHLGKLRRQRFVGVDVLELVHDPGEAIDLPVIERERLADFTGGTLATIGDDVGGHGRAVLAIFLIDMLDHAFAAIAARRGSSAR